MTQYPHFPSAPPGKSPMSSCGMLFTWLAERCLKIFSVQAIELAVLTVGLGVDVSTATSRWVISSKYLQ